MLPESSLWFRARRVRRYIRGMTSAAFDVFVSYSHEDEAKQGGRVLSFIKSFEDEYSVVTGEDLRIFVDRDGIEWGDAWRERISKGITEATFFLPVITPKFLLSKECRKEFLDFAREAELRSLEKLLLPILFVDVPNLLENSGDQVIAKIARTQYVSWTQNRLKDPNSPEVLQAVNALVLRVIRLKAEAASHSNSKAGNSGQMYESVHEIVAEMTQMLPEWVDAVEFDQVANAQWNATFSTRMDRIGKLRSSNGNSGAILSLYERLGRELQPIAEARMQKVKTYSRATIKLDPLVTKAIRLVKTRPEYSALFDEFRSGLREAIQNIELNDYPFSSELIHVSRSLDDTNAIMEQTGLFVTEANQIVNTWQEILPPGERRVLPLPDSDE